MYQRKYTIPNKKFIVQKGYSVLKVFIQIYTRAENRFFTSLESQSLVTWQYSIFDSGKMLRIDIIIHEIRFKSYKNHS